ncbi:MAG: signal peptidase II [Spirochaetaceae bacterium]|jgi:signal peptidase II|nr:signal peptidase II [Spirochaetaceae bacterium]
MSFLIKKTWFEKGAPFLLSVFVILADQLSKIYIVKNWPVTETSGGRFIKDVFENGLLQIVHVRNTVVAFSLGTGLPDAVKPVLFIVFPVLVLLFLIGYYFKGSDWTTPQRWAAAGVIGGGIGNIIDRICAHGGVKGVVDFISVKFFGGIFFDRWPTFNIADASVVVCVLFWFAVSLVSPKDARRR